MSLTDKIKLLLAEHHIKPSKDVIESLVSDMEAAVIAELQLVDAENGTDYTRRIGSSSSGTVASFEIDHSPVPPTDEEWQKFIATLGA